ncbi:hypothetical protein HZS_1430 [Henneguya salminicola]|nr:hypothetical protein HZS_1430 [Henneguya salminicola]
MESTKAILSNVELLTILKISEVINGINYIKSLLIQDEIVWRFFLDSHSNLAAFISVIKAEFDFCSEKYIEARENANGIVCNRERFKKPSTPNDYIEWKKN